MWMVSLEKKVSQEERDFLDLLVGKVSKEVKVLSDTGAQTVCLGRKVNI